MCEPWPMTRTTRRNILAVIASTLPTLIASRRLAYVQDKTEFPEGYDAVQTAPKSHRVVFENAFVRVLEVSVVMEPQRES